MRRARADAGRTGSLRDGTLLRGLRLIAIRMHNGPMMYAERGINQRNAAVIIAFLCSKLPISYFI